VSILKRRGLPWLASCVLWFALGLLVAAAAPALADGKVTGKVASPEGAPLAEIHIVLTPQSKTASRLTTKSSKKGTYLFGFVPTGQYSLSIEGTPLAVYKIKVHVADTVKHQDILNYEGPPPEKPTVFNVDTPLDVTYDLVLGDAEKSPAALAAKEAQGRAAAQEVPSMLASGDYTGALARLDEALKTQPDSPDLLYFRGYALFRAKKLDEAKAAIAHCLELKPSQVGAHFVLGGILKEQGDAQQALAEFRKELQNNTDKVGQINSYINIGLIQREAAEKLREKDREHANAAATEAIAAFQKVIELEEKQPEAYSYLADLYLSSGQAEKAAEVQSKSRELGLEDPKAVFNLGANFWNNKDYVKAEASFRHAVDLDPSFALAWKSLGYALVNLGKASDAVAALRKYLELAPKPEDEKEVKEMIDTLAKSGGTR